MLDLYHTVLSFLAAYQYKKEEGDCEDLWVRHLATYNSLLLTFTFKCNPQYY